MPTVLVTAGIREDKPPLLRHTMQQERALVSAKNDMLIPQIANQKLVLFTALDILLVNIRYWETLVLSTIKVSLIRTIVIILYQGKVIS